MFIVDIEQRFNSPNTSLRIEIKRVLKRPSAKIFEESEIPDDMVKYAFEQVLAKLFIKSGKL